MKNRWMAMILAASLAMNTAVVAVAGYKYYGGRQPAEVARQPHDMEHHFYEVLGLSATQLEKMRPLADSFHERLVSLHSEMSGKKDLMINYMKAADKLPDRIEKLRLEMSGIQNAIQETVIAHVLAVKKILDADQQERFFDLLRNRLHQERGLFIGAGEP